MKRILCSPYEEITDIDDALAKYKSHALNVMGEKDDISCSYFAKSNQTNRLGHSIRQHCMKPECSMADKEKIYKTMEELIQLGFDRASDLLLDIAIQESLPNAVCGKFKGKTFNLAQALSWYNYCYECGYRCSMEAGYKAGRVCEKIGDYDKAMEWYRKVLDWEVLSPTSWERNYRKEDEAKSLLPYRLEISFRNLKKRMNPEGHDRISITVKCSGQFSLRLKVLMNASVTITWDNGENANSEVNKWKVNGWNRLKHQYSKPGKHEIEICSDEENVITGIEIETAFSVTKMNLEACRGLEYLHCTNQRASINPKGLCGLRYLNIRNTKTKRLNIRGMHQLVALDISEIPSLRLVAEKYLPLRYFAMDGQSDLPKKTQLEENIKLNMGKIVPTIDIKRMETVHPTVFYL